MASTLKPGTRKSSSSKTAPRPASSPPRGRIVTFYSYKGGTGRSMALANVAWILASRGQRVLIIDWDLEAPGLHRYFHQFMDDKELTQTPGLIDLFAGFVEGSRLRGSSAPQDWFEAYATVARHAFSLDCEFPGEGTLDLLPAGRQGPGYASRVTSFNWGDFYEHLGGGVFLEALKRNLRAEYDFILIDSRTGISDTSGVCTIQMPDELVVCFTLNTQSIRGAAAAAESAFEQRKLPSGEPGLRIWPVPTRVELAERDRLEAARDSAHQRFRKFLHHVTRRERPRYWGQIEVPYQPYFAYDEVLATLVERRNQTGSLLRSFEYLTACLSDGTVTELGQAEQFTVGGAVTLADNLGDATFYLSYALRDNELAERSVEGLRRHLGRAAVQWDRDLLVPGDDLAQVLSGAMNRALVVLPLLTSNYLQGKSAPREAAYALMRMMRVVPILPDGPALELVGQSKEPLLDQLLHMHGVRLRTDKPQLFDEDIAHLAAMLRETSLSARLRRSKEGNSEDPLRGHFGREARRDGWQLSAEVTELSPSWFSVTLEVRGGKKQPLTGVVEFHLHPTFDPALQVVRSRDGVARLELQVWGAFTAGAVVLDTMTPLELDLQTVPSARKLFLEG